MNDDFASVGGGGGVGGIFGILSEEVDKPKWHNAPDTRYTRVASDTPRLLAQTEEMADYYAPRLREALNFQKAKIDPKDLRVSPSQYTLGAAAGLERALSRLEPAAKGEMIDVDNIYDVMLQNLTRGYKNDLLPQLTESFGMRGGRYSTDFARAQGKSLGDIYSGVGVERAKAKAGAAEKDLDRRLVTEGRIRESLAGLTSIGSILQALDESNLLRQLSEFRRTDMPAGAEYFPMAQAFLSNKPVYPPTITNQPSVFQPGSNVLDYLTGIAGVAGAFYGGASGGGGGGGMGAG